MKIGELKPLTKEQEEGIKKAEQERKRLIEIVQEKHQKYPFNKRTKK